MYDLVATYEKVDAELDQEHVHRTADQVIASYRRLAADPANYAEAAPCVPLRLIRSDLAEPREFVDAALRWLSTQPKGYPFVEICELSYPNAADLAAAVYLPSDPEYPAIAALMSVID